MSDTRRCRDHIDALIAAHGVLTKAVVQASQLMTSHGHHRFAEHLDHHRAELNVAIGEFGLWAESFRDWACVDVGHAIHPSTINEATMRRTDGIRFGVDLLAAREGLKSRRTDVLAELGDARVVLRAAGLPVDELTAYRRMVRLWAGEAIDLVTAVHRLELADHYIRSFDDLRADPDHDAPRRVAALLRQWMTDLEQADRADELAFAQACGHGDFVHCYLTETPSSSGSLTRRRRLDLR